MLWIGEEDMNRRGRLIVVEGTDCSGKETQTNLLLEKLRENNPKVKKYSFPNYNSATGKIVGGPYLGKDYICSGWFNEGASNVDPKVSSLYYAADRKYNIWVIEEDLKNGIDVILDRYVYSNMAHQGGKLETKEERLLMFEWLEKLEFDLLELPKADIKVFLHMPYEASRKLKAKRVEYEKMDQLESSKEHLLMAESTYLELSEKYNFYKIECAIGDEAKTIEEINNELTSYVKEQLNK